MIPGRITLYRYFVAIAAAVAGFTGCSGPQIAGSISETTNGMVAGVIIDFTGEPARRTKVMLLPAGYDPVKDTGDLSVDTTDSLGRYRFADIISGKYSIFATHLDGETNVSISGIVVEDSTETVAPSDTLRNPGVVQVMLSVAEVSLNGYLYIPGTPVFSNVSTGSGPVTLDGVPAEKITEVLHGATDLEEATVIRYDVRVGSMDTATIWNTSWRYSRTVILNTSASGAGVSGSVTDFPLLVRFNKNNFDFNAVNRDGSDIRFTKSDTTFLPHEMVFWDNDAGTGAFWVKVDTVFGNDSTQTITLYWGNPEASGISNGSAVFDTANGFAGVWHMEETSGLTAADASSNGVDGLYRGMLPNSTESPWGNGQTIARPDSDYIDMGDVLDPGINDLSIGIWIRRDSLGIPQALIGKTNGNLPSATYGYLLSIDPAQIPHFNIATGGAVWGDDSTFEIAASREITDSTVWHHIFVVIDRSGNSACRMYLDGVDCTDLMTGDITGVGAVANTLHFRIGTENDDNASYQGSLDEPTVAFTARSSDWVKLSYMNQKELDAVIVW
ncbi:MAG: DUF2341 domain-containing protein [Chitinispirillaceae bacterium]|nr:DUF2341 domain-containing protein [Chitinispirillaceae bacterium]